VEDLTSTVFLQAWRRRAEVVIDRDSSLPWLLGVARRLMETGLINAGFTAPPRRILAAAHVGAVTIRVPAPGPYRVTASAQIGSVTVTVPRSPRAGHVIQARTGTGTITIADS
jgi:hypothetical protein